MLHRFMAQTEDWLPVPDQVTEPRLAATVALVRDGAEGIETWMMRRVRGMAFAAGAVVFPGGGVDQQDGSADVAWTGPGAAAFAARLGTPAGIARALVTAAFRELFEEAGVLLARPLPAVGLEQARGALERHEISLSALVSVHRCALDTSALHPWARWVTPPQERRRYDTWFFVAALPGGARAARVSNESESAGWVTPGSVLAEQASGASLVLPPTRAVLGALAAAGSVAEVLTRAPARSLAPVHPLLRRAPGGGIDVVAAGEVFHVDI